MLSLKADTLRLPAELSGRLSQAWLMHAKALSEESPSYPPPSGLSSFHETLGELYPHWSGERLVTNSATEALFLTLLTLKDQCKGPFRLAVRAPCFFAVLRQAKLLDIELVSFEEFTELESKRFSGLLLTSHFAPPYGRSLSEEECVWAERLLSQNEAWLIEDNPYDALWFSSLPKPLKSAKAIRIGSVSKILSPAFRLGFLQTEHEVFTALRSNKITLNLSSAAGPQAVAAQTLQGDYMAILRHAWRERAAQLHRALSRSGIESALPAGGCYIGIKTDSGFLERAKREGVCLDENTHYYTDGIARNYARLNFGALETDSLVEVAARLGRVYAAT